MNMDLNVLHLFILIPAICVEGFVLDKIRSSDEKGKELNKYEKMGLKPVVESLYVQEFIAELCGLYCKGYKMEELEPTTVNYPQSETTTLREGESNENSNQGTDANIQDERIQLEQTTFQTPPDELTTEYI